MASERSIRCLSCFATRSASATPRSAAASGQTAAGADVPRPTTARNSTHVSAAVRRSLTKRCCKLVSDQSPILLGPQAYEDSQEWRRQDAARETRHARQETRCQFGQFANRCPHEAVEEKRRRRQELLAPFSKRVEKDSQKRIPVFQ